MTGASGSGKSTLLRLIGGLGEGPSGGSVTIDDVPVTAYEDRCGAAYQEARLMPWRSVADNVRLGLRKGTDPAAGQYRGAPRRADSGCPGTDASPRATSAMGVGNPPFETCESPTNGRIHDTHALRSCVSR